MNTQLSKNKTDETSANSHKLTGYAPVNGLEMYYEIEGNGKPLFYLQMGFGVAGVTLLPALAENHSIISVDLQGRGRTVDIDRPLSYEQQADDLFALLQYLEIEKADILGECVGGIVATLMAIRHPEAVGRVITYGTVFGKFHESYRPEILAHVMSLTPDSEVLKFQRESYVRVAPDPSHWPTIWMKFNTTKWSGFSADDLANVKARVLVAVGDHDWVRIEHSMETYNQIPDAEFAVIPDAGHFLLDAEPQKVLPLFETFLNGPEEKLAFATTALGYTRGATR